MYTGAVTLIVQWQLWNSEVNKSRRQNVYQNASAFITPRLNLHKQLLQFFFGVAYNAIDYEKPNPDMMAG